MKAENFISDYSISYIKFQNIHSAGADLFFSKPCIGYIKKGYAKFLYNGSTFYAHEGDLIYIAFETRYQSIWYGSPEIEWYSIEFDFYSKYSFYEYRFQIIKNYPSEILDKMYEAYSLSPMRSVAYLYELLDDIYSKMEHTPTPIRSSAIAPAIEYIENNYNKRISVKTLESLCHISKSGLFNRFKSVLGVTPITYKHNIMIQHSIDLLSSTDMSIEEISSLVGFSSSNHFRKVFSELTDKTPKELRKNKYQSKGHT